MLRWIDLIKYSRYGNPEPSRRVEKPDNEWRELLTPGQYHITREKGTERPYTGIYCHSYELGKYVCICCGQELFDSYEKYNSLSGWPGFTQPILKGAIKYQSDESHGMKRIEALCNVCDAHLGHVFPDGPEPAGLRYCINSESLRMIEDKKRLAIVGGGCFWCTEALFQQVRGVESVEPGYAGGKRFNPVYKEVSSGKTGHAEVIRIKYDPESISYEELLRIFFTVHDPTIIDPLTEAYSQYRSIILFYNEEQRQSAEKIKVEVAAQFEKTIFTEIAPVKAFYPAEEHHYNYYLKDPQKAYCQNIIKPKLEDLKRFLMERSK